jgi:hypothetical protein
MKIYFAGTISRENMGINERLKVKNHLESYFAFKSVNQEKFFQKLLGEKNESKDSGVKRNS